MKIEIDNDWSLRMAALEGDAEIGAGLRAVDPVFDGNVVESVLLEETAGAFGRFVRLMRRDKELTVEGLAGAADIEVAELILIESEPHYMADVRTVYQLAHAFSVPTGRLMQIAGRTVPRDTHLIHEAVRFAARSEPIVALSPEERAALTAFVTVLSEKN